MKKRKKLWWAGIFHPNFHVRINWGESINDFNWKCKYFFSIILNLEKMIFSQFLAGVTFLGFIDSLGFLNYRCSIRSESKNYQRLIWYKNYSLRNNRFSIGTMEALCHRKSKQRLLPWFTVVFLISLENYLDCFGNALFAFPGLKRTQSQDRNWFSFPGNAVQV